MTQLDVEWRRRVEFAAFHYAEAKRAVIRAAERTESVPSSGETGEMQKTMAEERAALREYTQILAIFTRLVLDGKSPSDDHEAEWSCPSHTGQEFFLQRRQGAE